MVFIVFYTVVSKTTLLQELLNDCLVPFDSSKHPSFFTGECLFKVMSFMEKTPFSLDIVFSGVKSFFEDTSFLKQAYFESFSISFFKIRFSFLFSSSSSPNSSGGCHDNPIFFFLLFFTLSTIQII